MIIDLQSIDENGKDYSFDELSDELLGAFKDLIGDMSFKINVEITPLGNTYQIKGHVESQYPEVCSLCGYDIDVPLKGSINEIVVIEKARPRNTQVSQSQQNFDSSGPSVTYVNEPSLDLREFLHEMMASHFQAYPVCTDVEVCEKRRAEANHDEHIGRGGHPGFEALKGVKTKH